MSLQTELAGIYGRKKRFLLLRIAGIETAAARQLCGVTLHTYNNWVGNDRFSKVYRRKDELEEEYKVDAIALLRRYNQLEAMMLENKLVVKMREEIETGHYDLIRTNLARDVYNKLISELDYQPSTQISWEQRLQQLFIAPQMQPAISEQEQLTQGGNNEIPQTESSFLTEYQESNSIQENQQACAQDNETIQTSKA